MKEEDREHMFLAKIVSALGKSIQDLDPEILSRLRHIRMQAQEAGRPGIWTRWGSFFSLPAAGLATAALVLLASIVYFALPMGINHHNRVEDVEILATTDNLEFYEDLDFYKWLTDETRTTGKESLFRNNLSLQYAWNNSPREGVTAPDRKEKRNGRQQPHRWSESITRLGA